MPAALRTICLRMPTTHLALFGGQLTSILEAIVSVSSFEDILIAAMDTVTNWHILYCGCGPSVTRAISLGRIHLAKAERILSASSCI